MWNLYFLIYKVSPDTGGHVATEKQLWLLYDIPNRKLQFWDFVLTHDWKGCLISIHSSMVNIIPRFRNFGCLSHILYVRLEIDLLNHSSHTAEWKDGFSFKSYCKYQLTVISWKFVFMYTVPDVMSGYWRVQSYKVLILYMNFNILTSMLGEVTLVC